MGYCIPVRRKLLRWRLLFTPKVVIVEVPYAVD
jgi:hypothetical protein